MRRLSEAVGLGLILGALHGAAQAVPVVPNFTQGTLNSRTETTSVITETINSMDYNTGYQYTITGTGIVANGNLSPTTTTKTNTIEGVNTIWTGISNRPSFTQSTPGEAFQFTETYQGPGLANQTIIQRTTEIQSVTESTSVFTQ